MRRCEEEMKACMLTAYKGTALEIFRAQIRPELAKNTKKCRKSFFHCVRINGDPLLNKVGTTVRGVDKARMPSIPNLPNA